MTSWMYLQVDQLLCHFDAAMIQIICHGHHAGGVQTIAKTSGAYLGVYVFEQRIRNKLFGERFRI